MVSPMDVKLCLCKLRVATCGQPVYNGCSCARELKYQLPIWDERGKQTNTYIWMSQCPCKLRLTKCKGHTHGKRFALTLCIDITTEVLVK